MLKDVTNDMLDTIKGTTIRSTDKKMKSLIKIMKNGMSEYNVAIDAINYLLAIY